MSASERATRSSTMARPSACLRSTPMERRPRFNRSGCGTPNEDGSTDAARSTRITSAPMSASIIAVKGPGPMPASSMTRTPTSGPDASTVEPPASAVAELVTPPPYPRPSRRALLHRAGEYALDEVPLEGEEHRERHDHRDECAWADDVDVRGERPHLRVQRVRDRCVRRTGEHQRHEQVVPHPHELVDGQRCDRGPPDRQHDLAED